MVIFLKSKKLGLPTRNRVKSRNHYINYFYTMELKRVVVTGLGAITPLGNTVEETWENIKNGKSGAAPITHFDATQFKTQFACEVKGFDPNNYIDRKESRKMDLYTIFALAAAKQAIEDSGIAGEGIDKNEVGVVLGVGIGGIHTFEEEAGNYAINGPQLGPKYNPFFIPKMIADIAAGFISIENGFHGPNFTTTSACASSTNALADAFNLIRLGKANAIVTGGSEAAIWPSGVGGFNAMKALSTRNDEPEKASRPFSASRDGFVMGEGSCILVLEELEHAKARGAKIYAEVAGCGMSADAYHITASHPEGLGAKLVMERALKDAEMTPADIDYINVHGTSTHVGDISEVKAIKEVFGDAAYKLNISSTKSMTGHLLGAAGAVEAMFSILSVKNDIVPPTINHDEADKDEEIDYNLNFTFNKAQKRTVRAALSNTFGFGGHNACAIFKKYEG
jgi:3-oxoacyl-[acyl-carrier-protein] synthase II